MNVSVSLFALLCVLAWGQPPVPAASTGVITGIVTDESGKPIVGARVQAVSRRKKWAGDYFEVPAGVPDDSDDRGHFRVHSLPPGRYVIAVSLQSKQPATMEPETTGYLRTYNPGTISLAAAQPIDVQAGREEPVSMRVVPVRFMSISGTVTTSAGAPAANFDVSLRGGPATVGYSGAAAGFMTTTIASARVAQDGSFFLWRVPAGVYTLEVSNGHTRRGQPLEIAEIPLQVTSAPVTGVKVATLPGATVSGRLVWADGGPTPWPREAPFGTLRATAVGRQTDFGSLDTKVQPDGTFVFNSLYGVRRIQALSLPFNWTVVSVGGPKDVVVGANLEIRPGTVVRDIEVTITNRAGSLWATVVDEDDNPLVKGSVLLMPTNPADLDPLNWGFRATQQNYGMNNVSYYVMERVVPGSYLAVAIDVEPYRLSGDADLMERARAAAVPVAIGEGRTPLRLRVLRLRPYVLSP